MMGIKERTFQRLPDDLSLETLVPKDNFYRRLEERIDLPFVRELVLPLYARDGRHSIDPVVFFELELVLFFEDLRSERQLITAMDDRVTDLLCAGTGGTSKKSPSVTTPADVSTCGRCGARGPSTC
jgi:hypothetical protein